MRSDEIGVGIGAVLFLLATSAFADQGLTKREHLDGMDEIAFRPPAGWAGVPPRAKYEGWEGTRRERWGEQVIRIAEYRDPERDAAPHELDDENYLPGEEDQEKLCRLTVWRIYEQDALDGALRLGKVEIRKLAPMVELEEPKLGKMGNLKVARLSGEGEGRSLLARVIFESKKRVFCVAFGWRNDDPEAPDLAKLAEKSLDSFRLLSGGEAKRVRDKYGRVALLADWDTHSTRSYDVQFNTDEEYAREVGRHLEAILALYKQIFPPSPGRRFPRFVVKLFADREGFVRYGGAAGAAAYYSPAQRELVGYRTKAKKVRLAETGEEFEIKSAEGEETFHIMYHEAYHQYMHVHTGMARDVEIPSWFNEGMGDYFFGGTFDDRGRMSIEVNDWRITTIQEALRKNAHVPLAEILGYDQRQYYANPGLCYAEGWSICYFLLQAESERSAFYRSIPEKMMYWLKRTGSAGRAFEEIWKEVDLDVVEAEWKEFMLALPDPNSKPGGGKPEDD